MIAEAILSFHCIRNIGSIIGAPFSCYNEEVL
jgi:hypothetical protein